MIVPGEYRYSGQTVLIQMLPARPANLCVTYIHVGDAEIDNFGHNAVIHESIRGSFIELISLAGNKKGSPGAAFGSGSSEA